MNILDNYINDNTNDEVIFQLAQWYENQKHYAPASGFYIKCAEFTNDQLLRYKCILRTFLCYKQIGNRDHTCENLLKQAITICPSRREAYFFLSQLHEHRLQWMDSYTYACIGLSLEDSPDSLDVGYEGEYFLVFQKAVASWWCGKPREARKLLRVLMNDYKDKLNDIYKHLIQQNLSTLGSGPESEAITRYDKSQHDLLRFKFPGSENIEKNFSQVCQDLFILAALQGKTNGTYLEIGAAHSFHNSNTALLEQNFNWTGVGIELNGELALQHFSERKNKIIHGDALTVDYDKLLSETFSSNIIDYLQLDIEPSKNTFEALLLIPFNKYKFRVITYEHDHYVDMSKIYREKSRRYLESVGYTLVFNDISPHSDCTFEDWWVNKDLIDAEVLKELKSYPAQDINVIKDVMFLKKKKKKKESSSLS